jgi:SmpA / OmlA family
MRRTLLILVLAIIAAGCGQQATRSAADDWRDVLARKKTALLTGNLADRQIYANSVAAFLHDHPTHGRAREVFRRIQLEFARDLSSIGRHQDAIRVYRNILTHDSSDSEARAGLLNAIDHLSVSHEKLAKLEIGMTRKQVEEILGKPIPGWSSTLRQGDDLTEAWYYRRRDGGVASVHFNDGRLFAADEKSDSRFISRSPSAR